MKVYKFLSIAFIVICICLMAGVLFFMPGAGAGRKVALILCLGAVILAMLYNLRLIKKKQQQGNE